MSDLWALVNRLVVEMIGYKYQQRLYSKALNNAKLSIASQRLVAGGNQNNSNEFKLIKGRPYNHQREYRTRTPAKSISSRNESILIEKIKVLKILQRVN